MSEEQMDLMIPLRPKGSRWGDNELRYCLRSFEQHLPNLGKVWIVGHKPDWLTGVEYIPCRHEKGWYKDARMMQRVLLACRAGISEMFIRASDDQTLLRSPQPGELVARYITHSHKISNWPQLYPVWYNRFANTIAKLKTSRCYDLHIPQPYQRDAVAMLLETTDLTARPGLAINTWILGQTADETAEGIPCGLWYSYSRPTAEVQSFLAKRFPTPSRFERPVMTITVVLLTCDRYDDTRRTVDSLLKHHTPGTLRLYHADDASTDPRVCRYVQSRGFDTIIKNTTRLGCSPTTELLMRAVAERVEPGSIVVYLQNDFNCQRTLPVEQLTQLLKRPDVEHVQLSYRRPRSPYTKATVWRTEDGRLWPFGDQEIAPVVFGGLGRGVGYHPSAARIETWAHNAAGVKQEVDFILRSERQDKQACRLTTPVFEHSGKRTTPNGLFGCKRKTRRAAIATPGTPGAIISMTTTPARGPQIEPVLDLLLAQGLPVYLWVPKKLNRTGETWGEIPEFFNKVHWEFVDDQGPITKLLPALHLHDTVITADDDMHYGEGWASGLLEWSRRLPQAAVAYRGRRVEEGVPYQKSRVVRRPRRPSNVNFITGVFGAIYRKSFFSHTIFSEWQQCPTNDDVVISAHLKKRGVPMTIVPMRCKLSNHKQLQRTLPLMWHNDTGPTDEGLRDVYWQEVPHANN